MEKYIIIYVCIYDMVRWVYFDINSLHWIRKIFFLNYGINKKDITKSKSDFNVSNCGNFWISSIFYF